VSSCGLSVLRAIEEHLIARKAENLTVKCQRDIASYILNEKRDNLLSIETSYGISVFIVASDEVKGSQAVIERAPDRNIPPRKVQAAPVRIDSAFKEEEEVEAAAPEAEPEEVSEEAEEAGVEEVAGEGQRDDGQRRKRRRGRRGGRHGRDRPDQRPPREVEEAPFIAGLGDQPDIAEAEPSSMAKRRRPRWPSRAKAGASAAVSAAEGVSAGTASAKTAPSRAARCRPGRRRCRRLSPCRSRPRSPKFRRPRCSRANGSRRRPALRRSRPSARPAGGAGADVEPQTRRIRDRLRLP
jgi:ribonuclease E